MQKIGSNRKWTEITGGVCAPSGFFANAVSCGLKKNAASERDFALIVSDRRCPTVCVYSQNEWVGAPVTVSKGHLKSGLGQGIVLNGGVANVFDENLAETLCKEVGKRAQIAPKELIVASTGKIGERLAFSAFEKKIASLVEGLGDTPEKEAGVLETLGSEHSVAEEIAYSFELGNFTCKIGGVFKGNRHVCPNMATFLVFLTTDVNITREMLQKALNTVVNDTFNLLSVDGISSPNDTVCMMANGKAGNCKIETEDSEYRKFCSALSALASEICLRCIENGAEGEKGVVCSVSGAKSKQAARAVAKRVIEAIGMKSVTAKGRLDAESLLCAIGSVNAKLNVGEIQISLCSDGEEIILCDGGQIFSFAEESWKKMLGDRFAEVRVRLNGGNYSAMAYGRILFRKTVE
ncbi:MAG: bifunctional ornithine acetyltransferase/N-acetylglutamate synthase [Clostridia bacterium]|nr:bifunctional ornithine acetyltransferase/N-acetylglutamate synthase [Clostridia bacterium]